MRLASYVLSEHDIDATFTAVKMIPLALQRSPQAGRLIALE